MHILMQRNDRGRTGVNSSEAALKPQNVNVNSFGRLHTVALDKGTIYAQPLYVAGLKFAADKIHDTVFVATMGNHLFAIDAQTGAILNQVLVDSKPSVLSHKYFGNSYNDIVSSGDEPTIGILSTPVIDLDQNEIHLVLFTVDAAKADGGGSDIDRADAFQYILYALDLTTLRKKRSVVIGGSVSGTGYRNSARAAQDPGLRNRMTLGPDGTSTMRTRFNQRNDGIGVIDATGIGTHNPRVHFNAIMQLQRPGLLLLDGVIYIAFGSRGDWDPYHGWLFAYRADDFARLDLLCTTANGAQGGIWQAGQGLLADSQGHVYAGTGNGDSRLVNGQPGTPNMGESFLKLILAGNHLQVVGWYNAFNDLDYRTDDPNAEVRDRDDDLGASAPALLPDGRIVGGGKDGFFYLIDDTQLIGDAADRQVQPHADNVVLQYFFASYNFDRGTRRVATNVIPEPDQAQATHHVHGAPVVWQADANHAFVYVWGENDVARAYRYAQRLPGQPLSGGFPDQGSIAVAPLITSDWRHVIPKQGVDAARGLLVASNEYPGRNGMPGGFLSLSWDGQNKNSAILWGLFPPFKNGNIWRVEGELVAYDASNFDPQLNFSRMKSLWTSRQDPADRFTLPKFCCPAVADGKVFVPTGDGSILSIYGLRAGGGGYDLSRDTQHPSFGGADGLTLNGSAEVGAGKKIVLTRNPILPNQSDIFDRVGRAFVPTFQAGSVFCTRPIDVTNLKTTFTVTLDSIDRNQMADGFTFTIQAVGPEALGSPGAGLGYALDPFDQTQTSARIPRSIAVAFNVVDNTVSLWRDGSIGGQWTHDLGLNGIALNSGHPIQVELACDHATKTLVITVQDLNLPHASTGPLTANNVDIPVFLNLGAPAHAFIGLTGGTGAKSAEQTILDWSVP
jgi:hypothetical protein